MPRPAPIVHQDLFTEAALHERPKDGHRTDGKTGGKADHGDASGKRSKKANGTPTALTQPPAAGPGQIVDVADIRAH